MVVMFFVFVYDTQLSPQHLKKTSRSRMVLLPILLIARVFPLPIENTLSKVKPKHFIFDSAHHHISTLECDLYSFHIASKLMRDPVFTMGLLVVMFFCWLCALVWARNESVVTVQHRIPFLHLFQDALGVLRRLFAGRRSAACANDHTHLLPR